MDGYNVQSGKVSLVTLVNGAVQQRHLRKASWNPQNWWWEQLKRIEYQIANEKESWHNCI